ncbi:hypothetical protein EUX98_g8211 [Antrodiella citrinella]|uniref:Diphthamide biosynthesis protein 4 n=1 Tax=Antrodiella citrinella TaxID=2447956 RepID=A0A4S4MBZ9_9APHY|nr:hypothetical protein EUX98_g8211 [Antrodiella citrinella]
MILSSLQVSPHHNHLVLILNVILDAHETTALPTYYAVLAVPRSASFSEIKSAYHRALLVSHPDKQQQSKETTVSPHDVDVDIDLIKQAYVTLSSAESRATYDVSLVRLPAGPRPAQVVSLEDFEEAEEDGDGWWYGCRCGGRYQITEADMEKGQHVVGCGSCSEVVWVGYELVDAEANEGGS